MAPAGHPAQDVEVMTLCVLAIGVLDVAGPALDHHGQFGAERTAEAKRPRIPAVRAFERRRQFVVVLGIGAVVDLVDGHGAPSSACQSSSTGHYSELRNDLGL
jgi:hypothetical protein